MHPFRVPRVVPAWVLALAVAGLFSFQVTAAFRAAGQRLGFVAGEGPQGVLVASIRPGLPADRAGLKAGDLILAVDGRPVSGVLEYDSRATAFRRGRPVSLLVVREGGDLEVRIVPGVPVKPLPLVLTGLAVAGFLAVALLALFQGLGDARGRLLFVFTALAALECALPVQAIVPPWAAGLISSAFYLLTGAQIGVQLHLASLIPERPAWLRPWVVPLYYAMGAGMGTAACAAWLAEEMAGARLPWSLESAEGLLLRLGLPAWTLAVTLILTLQALRHPEPRGRHQAGLVLAAALPWMLFVVSTEILERSGVVLPVWTGSLEALILLAYPAAFFVAIFRYHLFDIELAARRGLVYTCLTGSLALVFYAAVGAGSAVFSRVVEGPAPVWTVSASTLLLGLAFAPLRRSVHRLIDRRFFPERVALRRELIALAGDLPALGRLPLMGERLVERLTAIFLARWATLLIANPETGTFSVLAASPGGSPAPDGPASLTLPLLHQERTVGLLIVGPKEGSRSWPAEEVDLLGLLAHHVAAVLENARLFESATYEGLTGLLRREAILERLDQELERALRHGRPLAVAVADLDHFKRVNDQLGHPAGDSLLRRVAQAISADLRATDRVGRYGGEEFLVLLPETDLAGAVAVAEKIRLRVRDIEVLREDGAPAGWTATVSIGVAALEEGGGRVAGSDLIAAADRRLYEAKAGGRDRVAPGQKAITNPTLPSTWNSPAPSSS
ncbi:MAG TPA: diguanylate cyclase [Thermoanaerobaculia bacterium]